MANYYGVARTNYVQIENMEGLKSALKPWIGALRICPDKSGAKFAILSMDEGWPSWGTDENGEEQELDVEKHIMPYIKEGEVLVLQEVGHENLRYLNGMARAWIRKKGQIQFVDVSIEDIFDKARKTFNLPKKYVITDIVY